MIHLIYVSSATWEMSEEDLLSLLEQSRGRNIKQNVTGLLLYAGGNYIQIMEGDRKDLDDIYASILRDERNKGNIELLREKIDSRTFPQWSMGFKHLTSREKAGIKGYTEFLDRKMAPEEFVNKTDTILDLLYQFKENNT